MFTYDVMLITFSFNIEATFSTSKNSMSNFVLFNIV
jgi:hypothetical protein